MLFLSTVRRAVWGGSGAALAALLLLGCSGDVAPFQPKVNASADSLYWQLTLDVSAALLSTQSPYDTIRLVATPRDKNGNAITGLGPITFRSSDPGRVEVTPDGLVTARDVTLDGEAATVTAELVAGNVRHTADAWIAVTDTNTAPVPTGITFFGSGVNGDSATWPVTGDGSGLTIRGNGSTQVFNINIWFSFALDAGMNQIPGFVAKAASSDSSVATVLGGSPIMILTTLIPGRTTISVSGMVYGTPVSQSVHLRVTKPVYGVVKIDTARTNGGASTHVVFNPANLTILQGGTVVWANVSGQPTDIVFDDSTNVGQHGSVSCAAAGATDPGGTGNIAAFGEPQNLQAPHLTNGNCRSRSFLAPGAYTYHSTLTGATGQVVVVDTASAP